MRPTSLVVALIALAVLIGTVVTGIGATAVTVGLFALSLVVFAYFGLLWLLATLARFAGRH